MDLSKRSLSEQDAVKKAASSCDHLNEVAKLLRESSLETTPDEAVKLQTAAKLCERGFDVYVACCHDEASKEAKQHGDSVKAALGNVKSAADDKFKNLSFLDGFLDSIFVGDDLSFPKQSATKDSPPTAVLLQDVMIEGPSANHYSTPFSTLHFEVEV